MLLVFGLGNFGKKYQSTRHNAGFMFIDRLVDFYSIQDSKQAFQSDCYETIVDSEKTLLIKPLTYMNNSGLAVSKALSFYKLTLDKVIVIHDDIDLELGKVKVKRGGGTGGHNGLKSIDSSVGKDYLRIRIGVGYPLGSIEVSDYVLSNFGVDDKIVIENTIDDIVKIFNKIISEDVEGFSKYFRK